MAGKKCLSGHLLVWKISRICALTIHSDTGNAGVLHCDPVAHTPPAPLWRLFAPFSPLRAECQGSKGSRAKGNRLGKAEAKAEAAVVGRAVVTNRRPAVVRDVVPTAAADHPASSFFIPIPISPTIAFCLCSLLMLVMINKLCFN